MDTYETYGTADLWPLDGDSVVIEDARQYMERLSRELRRSMDAIQEQEQCSG